MRIQAYNALPEISHKNTIGYKVRFKPEIRLKIALLGHGTVLRVPNHPSTTLEKKAKHFQGEILRVRPAPPDRASIPTIRLTIPHAENLVSTAATASTSSSATTTAIMAVAGVSIVIGIIVAMAIVVIITDVRITLSQFLCRFCSRNLELGGEFSGK